MIVCNKYKVLQVIFVLKIVMFLLGSSWIMVNSSWLLVGIKNTMIYQPLTMNNKPTSVYF